MQQLQQNNVAPMNALARLSDDELSALRNSLYPGVSDDTLAMIVAYCSARSLDVMMKPVHPVWMSVKDARTGNYEWREVVMPGIVLYRIQAARSGDYAGASEPEFGPPQQADFQDKSGNPVSVSFPEWCRVTVYRIVNGERCAFTATERWLENYATDSKSSTAPNAMWRKRVYGQLAKCTEAQALRKAWPEVCEGHTAEEMEGKTLGHEEEPEAPARPALEHYDDERFHSNLDSYRQLIESGSKTADELVSILSTKAVLSDEQVNTLREIERENGSANS